MASQQVYMNDETKHYLREYARECGLLHGGAPNISAAIARLALVVARKRGYQAPDISERTATTQEQ